MSLFGPSIFDLVKKKRQDDAEAPLLDGVSDTMEPAGGHDPAHWQVELKKKRRALIMKRMLTDAGYSDLARMVNLKELK